MKKETFLSTNKKEGERVPVADFGTIGNPLGPSPKLAENIIFSEKPTEAQLKNRIARWLTVDSSTIALANGSSELIKNISNLYLNQGDSCVLPTPTYFGLADLLKGKKIDIINVPSNHEQGFVFDEPYINTLLGVIEREQPSSVWICSPNNPTGQVMNPQTIDRIADRTNGLVIIDEAYQELYDPENKHSAIHLLSKRKNILITKTFSKGFGIPTARVGMAIANPEILAELEKNNARESISDDSLQKALTVLSDKEHLRHSANFIKQETSLFLDEVTGMEHIIFGSTSQTGFFMLRHKKGSLSHMLAPLGIQAMDLNNHDGLEGMNFVRVGLKTHEENLRLLQALKMCDK